MTEAQLAFVLAIPLSYALLAGVFVTSWAAEFGWGFPFHNTDRPIIISLAIYLLVWLPVALIVIPAAVILRLCIPNRIVNQKVEP